MPKEALARSHQDRTANFERSPEEMRSIRYSIDEINAVIDGYPQLDQRLHVPADYQLPVTQRLLSGREVNIYQIPAGFDATLSRYRAETLANMPADDYLHGPPDPDMPTGGDWRLDENSRTVQRALGDNCRDFTQHLQPLVPGWKQLLSMPEGMPAGIGWYSHYWLSDMADSVTLRESKGGGDLDVLLYPRAGDPQSEPVFATPGGYVIKPDARREYEGVSAVEAATARRTSHYTGRDVEKYDGMHVRVKYPISSGNTLVAGLRTHVFARFDATPDYKGDCAVEPIKNAQLRKAGWVSLRALAEHNPTGGSSGEGNSDNHFPIWTTHLEYVAAGVTALRNPNNMRMFGMDPEKFTSIRRAAEALEEFPVFQDD